MRRAEKLLLRVTRHGSWARSRLAYRALVVLCAPRPEPMQRARRS